MATRFKNLSESDEVETSLRGHSSRNAPGPSNKDTDLHKACMDNDVRRIEEILSACSDKDDLTPKNHDHKTPLDVAIDHHSVEAARLIILSPKWKNAMVMTENEQDERKERVGATFPRLVAYMPSVAEMVLDKCVEETGLRDNEDYQVEYDFSFIDPAPSEETFKGYRSKVWYANDMVEHDCQKLLKHKLVRRNIKFRWIGVPLASVFISWLHHLTRLLCLVFYTAFTPIGDEPCYPMATQNRDFWNPAARMAVLFLVTSILHIIFRLLFQGKWILTKKRTLTNLITIGFISAWINLKKKSQREPCLEEWRCIWPLIGVAWFDVLLYSTRLFPHRISIYPTMAVRVLLTVVKVLILFVCFFFAMALCLYITIKNASFESFLVSLVTVFDMGMGEINYGENVFGQKEHHEGFFFYDNIILIVVFLILIPLTLINFLNSLAVDDIQSIRSKAEADLLKMDVESIDGVKLMIDGVKLFAKKFCRCSRKHQDSVTDKPNKMGGYGSWWRTCYRRCFTRTKCHRNAAWDVIIREEEQADTDAATSMPTALAQQLADLKRELGVISAGLADLKVQRKEA